MNDYRCSCPNSFTGSFCEESKVTICLLVFTDTIGEKREILELLFIMLMLRTTTTTTTMMMMLMMILMMIIIMMMMIVDLRVDGGRADRTKVGRGEGSQ